LKYIKTWNTQGSFTHRLLQKRWFSANCHTIKYISVQEPFILLIPDVMSQILKSLQNSHLKSQMRPNNLFISHLIFSYSSFNFQIQASLAILHPPSRVSFHNKKFIPQYENIYLSSFAPIFLIHCRCLLNNFFSSLSYSPLFYFSEKESKGKSSLNKFSVPSRCVIISLLYYIMQTYRHT